MADSAAPPARSAHADLIPASLWTRCPGLPPVAYHPATIEVGKPLEIVEGVMLLRLPLPFALNHINVYLLDDGDGWTLVDCGLDTPDSRLAWDAALGRPPLAGRPVRRIVVTHHHPDHIGLAGWLSKRCNAPVAMTEGELAVAGRYTDARRDVVAERTPLWHEHGLPVELAQELLRHMPRYAEQVHALPPEVQVLDPVQPLLAGGRRWLPMIGRGHAPDHLSLRSEDGTLLIGGDQVLPKITPNIAVWPGGDADPLRSYLASLPPFAAIGLQCLLLPSHRQPMRGVATRVEEIRLHHEARLRAVVTACVMPMTCHEMLPVLFGRALHREELGFGLGEAIAHLNFLASQGALSSATGADGRRRFAPAAGTSTLIPTSA